MWNHIDDKRNIENIETEVFIHGKSMKIVKVIESSKILRVHITPTLVWKLQFEYMK